MPSEIVSLFGLGNPILDISVTVSKDFLDKYDLKEDDAILADAKHMSIYDEIVKMEPTYVAGGATQNSILVAQWILGNTEKCAYTGSIKDDEMGRILQDTAEKHGTRTLYYYHTGPEPTGVCACLINGCNRSLVTNLAAACCFPYTHLDKHSVWRHVETARVFYIAGYVLTVSPDAILKIAKHSAVSDGKTFAFNLSAPFLCELFFEKLIQVLPYVNVLFGNAAEALALAAKLGWEKHSISRIAEKLSEMPLEAEVKNRYRLVVITQGHDDVITAQNGKTRTFPVVQLPPECVVDTNGAGDAFVGGFLSQLVLKQSVDECIRCAMWVSGVVIGRVACSLPETCTYH